MPSIAAIDSGNYGGYATTDCQAQMQPFTPTSNEIGPNTSQTYQLGDVFLRNVVSGTLHLYQFVFDQAEMTLSVRLWRSDKCSVQAAENRLPQYGIVMRYPSHGLSAN